MKNKFFEIQLPCRATKIDEITSGVLVPAAKKVSPVTESGILKVQPKEQLKSFIV